MYFLRLKKGGKRAFGSLALFFVILGCTPSWAGDGEIIGKYSNVMSQFGMNLLYLWRLGPVYLTKTENELPGKTKSPPLTERVRCKDRRIRLRMARDSQRQSARHVCEIAHDALQYVVDTLNSDGISIELLIVPPGHWLQAKRSAIGLKPKLTLGVATFNSPDLTAANVADVVAHESTHALMAKLGPGAYVASEYTARYFAMCGQLLATGKVMRDRIAKKEVSGDDFAASSSSIGAAVGREVMPLFQGPSLPIGSGGADSLLEQCRRLSTPLGRATPPKLNF